MGKYRQLGLQGPLLSRNGLLDASHGISHQRSDDRSEDQGSDGGGLAEEDGGGGDGDDGGGGTNTTGDHQAGGGGEGHGDWVKCWGRGGRQQAATQGQGKEGLGVRRSGGENQKIRGSGSGGRIVH